MEGEPVTPKKTPRYVLVLSRNCKAIRASHIIVCPVFPQRLTDLGETYKEAKTQLAALRDGARTQDRDRVYLGTIDEHNHRCAAHLDEVYTLEIPPDPEGRQRYVRDRRMFSLDDEFIYDLHARLFNSFARRGFDDLSWYSDKDLEYLLNLAEAEHGAVTSALAMDRASHNRLQGDHETRPKTLEQLEKAIAKKQGQLDELDAELAPLRAEADRRKTAQRPQD